MGRSNERELSDNELIELRGGLSKLVGALMRAWWLGMVLPRDAEEQKLFDEIDAMVGDPPEKSPEGKATPLGIRIEPKGREADDWDDDGLARISDEEYLAVFRDLLGHYRILREAYLRGMITASTPEQERQLAELRELLDK